MDRMDKNYYGPGPIKMQNAFNEIHKANMVTTEPGSIGAGVLESYQLSAETTSREITGKAENEILRSLRMTIF